MPATETLASAREARAAGDVDLCLVLSGAAEYEAVQEHDSATEYWSAAAPGYLYLHRMEPEMALGHFRHALDVALRHGLSPVLGSAYHDVARALGDTGDFKQFKERASTAFMLYRDTNPRAPGIAGVLADMAQAESDQEPASREKVAFALQCWRAVPTSMDDPRYRLAAASQAMHAASVLGIHSRYETAAEQLSEFLAVMPSGESVAGTLVYASKAALRMMDYERAADLAGIARQIAIGRNEKVPLDLAGEALIAALAERPAVAHI